MQSALHYAVLMTVVGLGAWALGPTSRRARSTPVMPRRPEPRRAGTGAPSGTATSRFATVDPPGPDVTRRVLAEAAHRCAIPTCRHPTTDIAHIVPQSQGRDDSFDNLIALCRGCQRNEIDRRSIRMYKRNLGILNGRYSDLERRLFDQIAETGRRSFVVQVGLEISLLHAVNDGLLKRVELTPVSTEFTEPTHDKYEVTNAGLDFVSRYLRGEDLS
ncbi:hypothetical protein A5647_00945 [Mycobacterium sp. 1100029.7]|nr:hypothetical protein A5647_00945 [Mycobacterium sp. 1100029.7]